MSKEEKIIEEIKSEISQLNEENKGGVLIPLKHFRIILDYIDNLQKEIEELKEDNKKLNDLLMLSELDYVSKDKIRNKIKELEKEMEKISEVNWKEEQIDILEELLGE